MISKLSERLSSKLITDGTITEDDKELYDYGLFMLLSYIIYLVLTCILGLILQCFFESIVFYIAFQAIRRYAGGYHASTEIRCEIMSTISIAVSIGLIKLSKIYDFKMALLLMAIIAALCIIFLCPLDTPEKPLSDKEYKYFRKISWIIVFVILTLAIITYVLKWNYIFSPCCLSLILETVLIIAGQINKTKQIRKQTIQ